MPAGSPLIVPNQPEPPYTSPSMEADLICRVALSFLANLICWIPLRNLYRHGELAAVCFVCSVILLNTLTIVNALIWRDDNIDEWWKGYGWCDMHPYLYQPALSVYTSSLAAIMVNLAKQVDLLRVSPLNARELRRKKWKNAMLIFSLPTVQIAWLYPLADQRYMIATLRGCLWSSPPVWPFLLFFMIPTPVLSFVSGFYAVLTWKRYTDIEKTTRIAILSNTSAATRAERRRRRLFLMTACVLVPYIPVVCALSYFQIRSILPLRHYDFYEIHDRANPLPWNSIVLHTRNRLTFLDLYSNYLQVLTTVPIFFFFGCTNKTKATLRHHMTRLRLDQLLLVRPRRHPRSATSARHEPQSTPTPSKPSNGFRLPTSQASTALTGCSTSTPPPPYSTRPDDAVDMTESHHTAHSPARNRTRGTPETPHTCIVTSQLCQPGPSRIRSLPPESDMNTAHNEEIGRADDRRGQRRWSLPRTSG
ncbi:Pheromone a factor receptor [Colletotrichum trifolii]|uniref:Pheromone a factor receptor n=1 Tax=Colletotrichum trifolii TaxID=5466 RepID=A0A4R8RR38_COLTR|nr:Pheromone a factor receptor [Colletotrichum trifolii]